MAQGSRRARDFIAWGLCLSLLTTSAYAEARDDAPAPKIEPTASAEPDCGAERYVTLTSAAGFDATLLTEVRKDLSAELTSRGLCVRAARLGQRQPAAEVELGQREGARVAIRVDDHTTGKQVSRDVSLSKIPEGGVALAIAIAIDELLRASWAELMLRPREEAAPRELPEPEPGPRSDVPAPRPSRAPRARPRWGLSLFGVYSHTLLDWNGLGPELRASLRPLPRLLIEVGAGGVFALPVESTLGSTDARGVTGLVSVAGCAEPHARLSVCGGGRGQLSWLTFRGSAASAAQAHERSLTAVVIAALLQLRVALVSRLSLIGEASLGGAVRGARATDGERTLLGLDGLVVGAGLGLEVAL